MFTRQAVANLLGNEEHTENHVIVHPLISRWPTEKFYDTLSWSQCALTGFTQKAEQRQLALVVVLLLEDGCCFGFLLEDVGSKPAF